MDLEDSVGNREPRQGQDTQVSKRGERHLVQQMSKIQGGESIACDAGHCDGESHGGIRAVGERKQLMQIRPSCVGGAGRRDQPSSSAEQGHFEHEVPERLYDIRGELLNCTMQFAEMVQNLRAEASHLDNSNRAAELVNQL